MCHGFTRMFPIDSCCQIVTGLFKFSHYFKENFVKNRFLILLFLPFSIKDLNLRVLFKYSYFKREKYFLWLKEQKGEKRKRESKLQLRAKTDSFPVLKRELRVLQIFQLKICRIGQDLIFCITPRFREFTQISFQSLTLMKSGIIK